MKAKSQPQIELARDWHGTPEEQLAELRALGKMLTTAAQLASAIIARLSDQVAMQRPAKQQTAAPAPVPVPTPEMPVLVLSAAFVRSRRQGLGLSQQALGDKAGIHQSTISKIELGLYVPDPQQKRRLALALGMQS